jgi:hypothetical protein
MTKDYYSQHHNKKYYREGDHFDEMYEEEDTSRNHNKPILTTEKLIVKEGEDIHLKKMK